MACGSVGCVDVPDPLPLRTIPVPAEVTTVTGCDCGGMTWHRTDCSLWSVPHEQATAAVDAAEERLRAFTAALNERLHAAVRSAHG